MQSIFGFTIIIIWKIAGCLCVKTSEECCLFAHPPIFMMIYGIFRFFFLCVDLKTGVRVWRQFVQLVFYGIRHFKRVDKPAD